MRGLPETSASCSSLNSPRHRETYLRLRQHCQPVFCLSQFSLPFISPNNAAGTNEIMARGTITVPINAGGDCQRLTIRYAPVGIPSSIKVQHTPVVPPTRAIENK